MNTASSSIASLPKPPRRLALLSVVLLLLSVLWTCRDIPGFGYALLMDDDTNLLFNAHLGELGSERLAWMFTDMHYVGRYMPLGWLSFNLVTTWSALSPAPCHVAGVAFHALNSVLVFFCLRRLVRRLAPGTSAGDEILGALTGALLWALHPLRVEPVAWCSGLLYVEGGFFALVCVYARWRELEERCRPGGPGRAGGWFALSAAAFAVSLLIYPVALFLPAALLLLEFAWLRGQDRTLRRKMVAENFLLGAMAVAALAATLRSRHILIENGIAPVSLETFGVIPRLLQAAYVWASYLWRTIWPADLKPVMEALFEIRVSDPRIWGALPTLLVVTWLAWRWRRAAPFIAVCWGCYLVWMIPVLGLTEHPHVPADRYSYVVSLLFSAAIVFGILRVRGSALRQALFGLSAVIAAVWAWASFQQSQPWRDTVTMHEYVLTRLHDPDLRNITRIRLAKIAFLSGSVREAREQAEKIHASAPGIAGVERSWREMQPVAPIPPELAEQPLQEWRVAPWAYLHERIARDQLNEGRVNDALIRLDAALELAPGFIEVRFQRALVLAQLGRGRAALHDWLVVENSGGRRAIAADGLRFAAQEIGRALRSNGENRLAEALEKRAGD